jgi:ElaB/YqjD/DUF883 family membrane-anchored ribosome-binding protein
MIKLAKSAINSRAEAESVIRDMQRDLDKRIDAIRSELKAKGPDATESIERSLSDLRTGIGDRLSDMRDNIDNAHARFDDAVETSRSTIQERPLMAVGVAAAVGIMVGLIFSRKGAGRKNGD